MKIRYCLLVKMNGPWSAVKMILLDTCSLLWLASDHKKFSAKAAQALQGESSALYVCSISLFEIAIKFHKGKIELPKTPDEWFEGVMEHHGLQEIPVDSKACCRAAALPPIHNDPFDRIIFATAKVNGLKILTPDQHISQYDSSLVVW